MLKCWLSLPHPVQEKLRDINFCILYDDGYEIRTRVFKLVRMPLRPASFSQTSRLGTRCYVGQLMPAFLRAVKHQRDATDQGGRINQRSAAMGITVPASPYSIACQDGTIASVHTGF
jgi:hypothetical protein